MLIPFGMADRGLHIIDRYERSAAVERRCAEAARGRRRAAALVRQSEPNQRVDVVAQRAAPLASAASQFCCDVGIEFDGRPHAQKHIRECADMRRPLCRDRRDGRAAGHLEKVRRGRVTLDAIASETETLHY